MKAKPLFPIPEGYDLYLKLMEGRKTISSSPIVLVKKGNHPNRMVGKVDLMHLVTFNRDEVDLLVEASTYDYRNFGFKLRADFLSPEPCFRFDGDGPTHRNDGENIPLPQRQVTTPHFHRYRKDGVLEAYKTPVLQNPVEENSLMSDINFALAHFCQEANIRLRIDEFPEVQRTEQELPFSTDIFDPLNGVKFSG